MSDLQFDTAIPQGGTVAAGSGAVACASCTRTITSSYYDVSGHPTCPECRTNVGRLMETPEGAMPFVMAVLFGLGAGIAGAIVYYAVLAITGWEIGIVAILIGYMVGWAVRKGAGGGGRRFQVLAVALTYLAVAMAYTPIAVRAALNSRKTGVTSTTATASPDAATPPETAAPAPEPAPAPAPKSAAFALVFLAGLIVALPVLAIVGGLPSSIISAAIIFFGMKQAWKITGTPALAITGPYRVGTPPAASA